MMNWKKSWKKTLNNVGVMAVGLSIAANAAVPAPAEAFNIGGAIGAVVGTVAQYEYLNKQVNYLDNDGRDQYAEQMKREVGVNHDPALNAILDGVMARLSASIAKTDPSITEKPYNYFINNDPAYNAFCTLGHNLSVNQGMFALLDNNVDELAVVVAHEMGHGQKNHPVKGVKSSMPLDLLNRLYQSQNPGAISTIGSNILAGSIKATGVTKPMEVEADNLAFDYTVNAGYNIGAGAAVWQRFIDKMGQSKTNFVGELFSPSDHPSNESRRDSYAKKLTEYSKNNVAVDAKTGAIKIKGKVLMIPAADASRSARERSYFIAGNLAAVYHNNKTIPQATFDGNIVKMGTQPIFAPEAGENAAELAKKLNSIK